MEIPSRHMPYAATATSPSAQRGDSCFKFKCSWTTLFAFQLCAHTLHSEALQSCNPSEGVGEYLPDPVEVDSAQHAEACVQSANDVPLLPSCFTASKAITEKVDDINDGIIEVGAQIFPHLPKKHFLSGSLSLVEVSDDQSINGRYLSTNKVFVDIFSLRLHWTAKVMPLLTEILSSRLGIAVPSLIELEGYSEGQQAICCCQTMAAQASFLGADSVSSTENGGNHAISAHVPSHILHLNNVAESVSVGSDVISSMKLAGYLSEEKHIPGRSNNLLEDINDPLLLSAKEVGDHVDSDHQSSKAVVVANEGHLPDNIELPWDSQKDMF
ncbi:hypothetical protein REPUB_Repub14bG0035200 [Reevesia pubescens]